MVIYDDFDLEFGKVKLRKKGGAGTHNGMKSLIQVLGSNDFPRIRVGIGPKPEQQDASSYVLSNFSTEQQETCPQIVDQITHIITFLCDHKFDLDLTMNRFN